MPTPLTDADKVLRNDTGKDIVTQLTSIANSMATPASLVGLSDTSINTPTDGQELVYNNSLSKWNNKTTRVELTQQQYDLLVANNEDLPDVDYYITDAGGAEVVSSAPNISDVYNPNTKYNTGNLCIYNNVLYKCKTNNVTGAWDGTKWTATTIDNVIGDLSQLTTSDKSSLVGAVNEVNKASLKAYELRVIRETKTTNNYGTIDSNGLTGGAIPLSRTILSAYSPSGYFVKIGYYSTRYTFDIYDNSFQLVRNTDVEICIVSTADLTK